MSYRYSIVDVIVGVGMCAIIFGALLFVVAANGTYQAALPQPISIAEPLDTRLGMTLLQPALGQAIVDQAIFEHRANQRMTRSASEWNRATLAQQEFQSLPGGPFGAVMHQAAVVPADHRARVQMVMGRAIVNVTARGIRSGRFSADLYLSDYNNDMIRRIEARGQRLSDDFAATWQAVLGREIVDAVQGYTRKAGAIQERLGTALLQVVQAQRSSEAERAAQQGQLASLVVAAVRTEALADRLAALAAVESSPAGTAVAVTEPTSWPELPMGYWMAITSMLAAVFFGGIVLSARSREIKALEEMKHREAHWVYRMAA